MDIQFDFIVENLSEVDAEELLNLIIAFVEEKKTVMGGGFRPVTEEEV